MTIVREFQPGRSNKGQDPRQFFALARVHHERRGDQIVITALPNGSSGLCDFVIVKLPPDDGPGAVLHEGEASDISAAIAQADRWLARLGG